MPHQRGAYGKTAMTNLRPPTDLLTEFCDCCGATLTDEEKRAMRWHPSLLCAECRADDAEANFE